MWDGPPVARASCETLIQPGSHRPRSSPGLPPCLSCYYGLWGKESPVQVSKGDRIISRPVPRPGSVSFYLSLSLIFSLVVAGFSLVEGSLSHLCGRPGLCGEIKLFQPEYWPDFRIGTHFIIISQVSGMLSQGTLSPESTANGPR